MSGAEVRYEDFLYVADDVLKKFAIEQFRDLVTYNPKRTGRTARGWRVPTKTRTGAYFITNKVSSKEGNIAFSLNERKLLLPKGARPTVTARNSRLRNVSFAVKGEGFIDKVLKGNDKELMKRLQDALEGMA